MRRAYFIGVISLCFGLSTFCFGAETIHLQNSPMLSSVPPVSGEVLYASQNSSGPDFVDMSASASEVPLLSMKKGLLLSVLLPGAGEYYAGAKGKGQLFMGVEAALWGGFAAYRIYGGWRKDDYKKIATAHAGVDVSGKDDTYFDMVGFYSNREEYNQFGRLYYPDRPYYPDNDSYFWQWDSDAQRQQYKELKDASKTAFRNSTFMLGLALANRVISAIDTYRTIRSANKKMKSMSKFGAYRLKVSPRLFSERLSVSITLSRKF